MATNPLIEIRNGRIAKAAAVRALGLNPYPSRSQRTHYTRTILNEFESHEGKLVTVAGRLMSWRKQGALAFAHVQDQTGRLQLFLRRNLVQATDAGDGRLGYAETNLLDLGDLIEATGKVVRTERGEISVMVEKLRLLTKAVRPLPDQWSGLEDTEIRYRQRYLDLLANPDVKDVFLKRSEIIREIREFLHSRGYVEVETPMMQAIPGGAAAQPFKTHHNALGCDFYLRIALELPLKRMLVGGVEKVFEIGRVFRNEGLSRKHNPEFTMLEAYEAFGDYESMMELVQSMICHVAQKVMGTLVIKHDMSNSIVKAVHQSISFLKHEQMEFLQECDRATDNLEAKHLNEVGRRLIENQIKTLDDLLCTEGQKTTKGIAARAKVVFGLALSGIAAREMLLAGIKQDQGPEFHLRYDQLKLRSQSIIYELEQLSHEREINLSKWEKHRYKI